MIRLTSYLFHSFLSFCISFGEASNKRSNVFQVHLVVDQPNIFLLQLQYLIISKHNFVASVQ